MAHDLVFANANTSTGTQTITGSIGGVNPKAAVLMLVADVEGGSPDNGVAHAGLARGMTDGTNVSAYGHYTEDAIGKLPWMVDFYGAVASNPLLGLADGAASYVARADFDSWTTDGIVIDWITAPPAGWRLAVMLFGGSDVSVDLQRKQVSSSATGAVTVTTGFATSLVFAQTIIENGELGIVDYAWTNLGIGSPNGDVSISLSDEGGSPVYGLVTSNRLISGEQQVVSSVLECSTENYTSTTYDIRNQDLQNKSPAPHVDLLSIELSGHSVQPFSGTTRTSTGAQSITGLGGAPDLVFGFAGRETALDVLQDPSEGLSAFHFDASNESAFSIYSESNTTANAVSKAAASALLQITSETVDLYETAFTSMDSDGFTWNFGTANGTARAYAGVAIIPNTLEASFVSSGSSVVLFGGEAIAEAVGAMTGESTFLAIRGSTSSGGATSLVEAAYAADTDDVILVLLTIDHADLSAPIRVVNNTEPILSNGNEFTGFPFDISLPDSREDAPPRAQLVIDNVSREIGQAIRLIRSAPTVLIQIIRASDPNTIERQFNDFVLNNVIWDATSVSGELSIETLTSEPFPADDFTPAYFPGLF